MNPSKSDLNNCGLLDNARVFLRLNPFTLAWSRHYSDQWQYVAAEMPVVYPYQIKPGQLKPLS